MIFADCTSGGRRPDPTTRLPGPPPPPSVSRVQRANPKDKREKNKKRGKKIIRV